MRPVRLPHPGSPLRSSPNSISPFLLPEQCLPRPLPGPFPHQPAIRTGRDTPSRLRSRNSTAKLRRDYDGVKDLILAEVNVKDIEYVDDASGVIKKKAKPNFKRLGRRLGKHMKAANQAISSMSNAEIAAVEKAGGYTLVVEGESYALTLEDFEISTEDIPGWLVASDGDLDVALDVTITPALRAEGMARELVNRIQNIRKDKDFNVTDRIRVTLQRHEAVAPAVEQFGDYIKNEVLAEQLELVEEAPNGETIELPEEVVVSVAVRKSEETEKQKNREI